MMNLREYQEKAVSTAIYPDQYKIAYPALGLIGELCELWVAVVKYGDKDLILKEAGDVAWYCANLANDLDLRLDEVVTHEGHLDLPGFVDLGRIAETAKKYLRDGNPIKHETLKLIIANSFAVLYQVAGEYDTAIDTILKLNIEKLTSRKERGVLKGDGDNR